MRKIIITTFVSLDGVMQAPGGPDEDRSNGFPYGGWMGPHGDDQTNETMGAFMSQPFDLLLGRFTYDIFAAYWPYISNNPIAEKFNTIHKYVVSGQQRNLEWKGSTLITGDVVAQLGALKQEEGPNLVVYGSGKLVQTLLANDLADELHTWIFPVTIGEGKRLFAEGTKPANWKMTQIQSSSKGVIMASYEPAGAIQLELIGEDNPSEAELARRKKIAAEG